MYAIVLTIVKGLRCMLFVSKHDYMITYDQHDGFIDEFIDASEKCIHTVCTHTHTRTRTHTHTHTHTCAHEN